MFFITRSYESGQGERGWEGGRREVELPLSPRVFCNPLETGNVKCRTLVCANIPKC